jgi:hypothetical protein
VPDARPTRVPPRGEDANAQPDRGRQHCEEQDSSPVDGGGFETRDIGGKEGLEPVDDPLREQQADEGRGQRHRGRLDQQLPGQRGVAGTERGSDRQLEPPLMAMRQAEGRRVHRCHEQHHANGAEHRVENPGRRRGEGVSERGDASGERKAGVPHSADGLVDVVQLVGGAVESGAGAQPRENGKIARAGGRRGRVDDERRPPVPGEGELVELGRGHRDHGSRPTVEVEDAADDVQRSSVASPPQPMAEDDDPIGSGPLFFGSKDAPSRRPHPERVEHRRGDLGAADAIRASIVADRRLRRADRGHRLQPARP